MLNWVVTELLRPKLQQAVAVTPGQAALGDCDLRSSTGAPAALVKPVAPGTDAGEH